jgi:hypothetical protein
MYPGDDAIHDAGQVALIRRLRQRIGSPGRWDAEVPIPADRDQRAFDAVLTLSAGRVGLEFFVRLADAQAQWRAANLKKRDAGLDRLLVVLADTPSNRRALRQVGSAFGDVSVGHSRTVLAQLTAGVMPESDGIILI